MKLPDNFAEEYFRNGAAVIPDFITTEECDELQRDMHDLIEKLDFTTHLEAFNMGHNKQQSDDYFLNSADGLGFFLESSALVDGKLTVDRHKSINKIGHALHAFRPAFRKVAFHMNTKEVLRVLGFTDPVVPQTMYIFKQPRIGDAVDMHQDSSYLYVDPPEKLIGIWIALEDATKENGCLWYVPGSHKDGVRGLARLVRKVDPDTGDIADDLEKIGDWTKVINEGEEWVPLEVKKGTAVLIHGNVVHKSHANTSNKPRPIFTWHLFDNAGGQWDKLNWLQTKRGPFWSVYNTNPNGKNLPEGWAFKEGDEVYFP